MQVEEGQVVFVNYNNAEGNEAQWAYGVVTEVFDDRFVACTPNYQTVFYTDSEAKERNKGAIEKSGIVIEELYRNGKKLLTKKRGIFNKYYVLPNGIKIYL